MKTVKKIAGWYFKFNKRILKGYFGIETPVYKCVWQAHSEKMQKLLDMEHFPSKNNGSKYDIFGKIY